MKKIEEMIDTYAKSVIEIGINPQKGEPVRITGPIEGAYFVRKLVKYAYERGAGHVVVDWNDDEITHMEYEYESKESLSEIPKWAVDKSKYYFEKGVNIIRVAGGNPALLADIDPEKVAARAKASSAAFKPLMKYTMNDICSWCVVAIPQESWAKEIFPELSAKEGMEKLWELVLRTTRMDEKNPIEAWKNHIKMLEEKASFLQNSQFDMLEYKSKNGTDLKVGLPKGHKWVSAASKNAKGTQFVPNMPTEEVFTMPDRLRVDGTLCSTKPLSLNGNIIKDMRLEFKNGRCEKFSASQGEDILEKFFRDDENSRYLGEVALVPFSSPINRAGVLFFNTLFDENASCHFAFGAAYPTTLTGGEDMSDEELLNAGANCSINHEDFMVGSEDLSIIGVCQDGSKIQIFKDGEWEI